MNPAHGLGVQPGSLVGQIVTGHSGHRRVSQAHPRDRVGDPLRFAEVQRLRAARVDLAEVAPARAGPAAEQERRLAILPAFVDIGAAGLLADGVQSLSVDEVFELAVFGAEASANLDPGRLALDRCAGVAGLHPQQPPALGGAPGRGRGLELHPHDAGLASEPPPPAFAEDGPAAGWAVVRQNEIADRNEA